MIEYVNDWMRETEKQGRSEILKKWMSKWKMQASRQGGLSIDLGTVDDQHDAYVKL